MACELSRCCMMVLLVSRFIGKIFNDLNVVEHLFLPLSKCVDSFMSVDGYMSSSHEGFAQNDWNMLVLLYILDEKN